MHGDNTHLGNNSAVKPVGNSKDYLQSKDFTWKDSPMTLKQVHDIARFTNSYGEFKAEIDKIHNGTPETVVDFSEYVLTKKK